MQPIEIKPKQPIIEIKEDDLDIDYSNSETYHYMPEFLEEVYDGANAQRLKDANVTIKHYAKIRDELGYIGSIKCKDIVVEYYLNQDNEYVILLIDNIKNKKYYPSLQQVTIAKRKDTIQ